VTPIPDEVRFAVGTLTRVPVPAPARVDTSVAGRGLVLSPVVGAAIGLVSGLPQVLMGPDLLTRLLSATLTVAAAAWLTRGLHWDGLADMADGLGARAEAARAREIMRRSDIGPFGVLTVLLVLAVQVLALSLLPSGSPALAGWVAAATLGRTAIALGASAWVRPARDDGLGSKVIGSVTIPRLATAAALAVGVLALTTVLGPLPAGRILIWAPLAAAVSAIVVTRVAARRLGGSTGDVLGATCELATAAALLALVL
jgi:adenosylcobinamide-GDP ribazoletransferase